MGDSVPSHLIVDTHQVTHRFDRRLLGSNVPAWLSPQLLKDPLMIERTRALDLEVLRMPGGSWSNGYDWLACERGGEGCVFPGALGPGDFLEFLDATGTRAMWTVNINGTPEEAAALVAYFNGSVDDERPLGVDRRGRNWRTVGHWARIRASGGHADPLPVELWEVGNEVYAARGDGCAEFAWEDVWTCDGRTYVEGDGTHEGFLAFRSAMRDVDPTISVGAVGVEVQETWGGWGDDVITSAGESLDFYAIHHYAFTGEPDADEALGRTIGTWPRVMDDVHVAREAAGVPGAVDVAVTEYNLVAFQDADRDALMSSALDALYLADTVGQMAVAGVAIANQWNLANGVAENGTDYGLLDTETAARRPQYFGLALWRWFGEEIVEVRTDIDATTMTAYAARNPDGTLTALVVNKTADPRVVTIELDDDHSSHVGLVDTVTATSPTAREVSLNGATSPSDDLTSPASRRLEPFGRRFDHEFPPWSITLLRLSPAVTD